MTMIPPGSTIGIIGGGQLGRMSALAAAELGYKVHIYTPEIDSPASHVASKVTVASYTDEKALKAFARSVDVVTFEFENIPVEGIKFLADIVPVRPNPRTLYIAQHRKREKEFAASAGIQTAPFTIVKNAKELEAAFRSLGVVRGILKTLEMGYDGKGQRRVNQGDDYADIWADTGFEEAIFEGFIEFEKEISVIVARGLDGNVSTFPPAENTHVNGILDTSKVPSRIAERTSVAARAAAHKLADALDIVGLLAVEFFVLKEGSVVFNEMAPRPHNSGHWTMDGCVTSQFDQFIRAVCGLPLGSVRRHSDVVMKNLIGHDYNNWQDILAKDPHAKVHLYGKREVREGRKMGHVNYVSNLTLD
ncbi:MAG: 5-(carboxyamino)imidazole ribonucleotide synthase [Proteobacteria bacterium]|nr:5-(carboxyamino)imidazole ribonucleotide synthase [Pseudomonadota bacterium]